MHTIDDIIRKIDSFDPVGYGSTRNYLDGGVSRLSPYISRGVISTKFVLERLYQRGFRYEYMQKFVQELAWRDYFQQVWVAKGEEINHDLKHPQEDVENFEVPQAVIEASTGISSIDRSVVEFYTSGYMHNHMRMYVASLVCNVAKSHWKLPARWLYYHLLDADWASNALSWQWVAGAFSNKKYFANQENINKYSRSHQRGTFLDLEYDQFQLKQIPDVLRATVTLTLETKIPGNGSIVFDPAKPTLIYNFYNMDPLWKASMQANRILLLEPSHFNTYPVSEKSVEFMLVLTENIPGIQIFRGEFHELIREYKPEMLFFKEHPLFRHYRGIEESRDWMFSVSGYFPSFFAFWKRCERELPSIS